MSNEEHGTGRQLTRWDDLGRHVRDILGKDNSEAARQRTDQYDDWQYTQRE